MNLFNWLISSYLAFGQLIPQGQQEIVKYGGIQVIHADGAVTLRLKETVREERKETGARHMTVTLRDEHYPFQITRHVRAWDDVAAVETWAEIRHDEPRPVKLLKMDSLAAAMPVQADVVKVMSLCGVWGREANLSVAPVGNGQIVQLCSKAGTRDAWESNAGMMVEFGADVSETTGRVLGVALEWTGTTERSVRRDWNGSRTEVFAGASLPTGPYTLDPGVTLELPRTILVWSEKGRGEVSRQYHRWARNHLLPHGRDLRPVLLNSWEGSYFSFTEKTLTDMMDGVKEMGGELFVLDDGWFGWGEFARDERNQDRVGLGDWRTNPAKLPHGLGWLAGEANRRGLQFGLWVEPEMANTRSHLVTAHPEWVLRETNRSLALGRGGTQVVLDYCNPAVRENLFAQLDAVFGQMPTLAYVKWDSNQNIVNPGSTWLAADRQPNLWFDYTKGLYEVLARLRKTRPNVLIQACASGGGHTDFGFLRYADEFWTSDDTDPLRRVFIQWGVSQFYPACAMACHVTASPNHQTKRETPLKYRFDVAMTGRMGFELHPANLTPAERAFAKSCVADYKAIRATVQQGDLYRLASPYENDYAALMYVSGDKAKAAVFMLGLDRDVTHTGKLRLEGLDAAATYRVRELSRDATPQPCDGLTLKGAMLMKDGLDYSLLGRYDSFTLTLERL